MQGTPTSDELTQIALLTPVAPREATPPPEQTAVKAAVPSLNLEGRMVFLNFIDPGDVMPGLVQMSMKTGEITVIFRPAATAYVSGAMISPDGTQIALAYAPPPPPGKPEFGPTDLYLLLTAPGATPKPLLKRTNDQEAIYQPSWSPDGAYVYFTHFKAMQDLSGQWVSKYAVERIRPTDGKPEAVVDRAIWPRLSPDGRHLAFVAYDPAQQVNDLYLADADGSHPVPLLEHGIFTSVDAPFFTPDGQRVIFSATGLGPVARSSLLDRLLGIWVASANGQPSDWWSVAATGGKPNRVTAVYQSGLNGAFSPDGRRMAFVGSNGLFVMDADGKNLVQLLDTTGTGAMQWLP